MRFCKVLVSPKTTRQIWNPAQLEFTFRKPSKKNSVKFDTRQNPRKVLNIIKWKHRLEMLKMNIVFDWEPNPKSIKHGLRFRPKNRAARLSLLYTFIPHFTLNINFEICFCVGVCIYNMMVVILILQYFVCTLTFESYILFS